MRRFLLVPDRRGLRRQNIDQHRPKHRPTLAHIAQHLMVVDRLDPNSDVHCETARDPPMYIYKYEHRKKRPTTTVHNQFRPPETNAARRQGRLARSKNVMWLIVCSHPTDFRVDRCDFSPAACWTRFGGRKYPSRPRQALFTPIRFCCWGVSSSPQMRGGKNTPTKKRIVVNRAVLGRFGCFLPQIVSGMPLGKKNASVKS